MDLILTCHGTTDADAALCVGHGDPPLSARGFTDVQGLAAGWTGAAPRFLFSSDLRRAQQSAQVFAARFAIEPLVDERLREFDFGRWEGRRWDQIAREDALAYRHWLDNWVIQPAPDGESFADVLRRTAVWLSALLGTTQGNDRVLAVAHPGSIRALLCHALGLPPARATALAVEPAKVTRVCWRNGQFDVACVNSAVFPAD
ncbi:MAG TPA: histidine phosphatase family protein [Dokdonella sp.]|uniref:histidine phosphatase family protein n=1 Tax=Dokdonella sp. TaxID=2291710 RepID=UPI0025C73D23|nr:histidine phosphatase family protein [Dokdonella sp.]MBX3691875.1 histidine phosphatase family protein [Dokdonella sp.]HNR92730.1 histidine phosphatase family protein [Dokdonella sp.]